MNYASRNEHVPEAERNNRTLAATMRATFNNLPYKAVPKAMIKHIGKNAAKQRNMFPAKGGISPYYSPHVLLENRDKDYEKDFQAILGDYCQVQNQDTPYNTMAPRAIHCIYLCPAEDEQGGHVVMDLRTGRETTRFGKINVLPVTDLIIKRVEAMAAKQGIKSLKIQNRTKSAFYPADWIAGVDYEDTNNQNDEESDDEDDVVPALAERPIRLMDSDYEEAGQELENDHTLNENECDNAMQCNSSIY